MKSIFSNKILLPEGLTAGTILIDDNKIVEVRQGYAKYENIENLNAGNAIVMPGLIDPHVHVNEPGRTKWEGFDTATKAAAAGGVTTIIDMPLNSSPVTVSASAFDKKIIAAKGKMHVNCGFWGGLVPGSLGDLPGLLKKPISGIKVFLTHSGIDEFPNVEEKDLLAGMPLIRSAGMPILAHCELSRPHPGQAQLEENPTNFQVYLASRPPSWEIEAIELMIRLCRETGCRTHIVHLSTAEAIPIIEKAKAEGLPLTLETCAHYLFFASDDIPDGKTIFKCAPPIRNEENREKLWAAVKSGLIDFLGTDHSPAPPGMKEIESGNLAKAWGGIAGLQFFLPAVWTKAKEQGFSIEKLSRLWSLTTAKFLGLNHRKGEIAPGFDADLVIWEPEDQFVVTEDMIFHRHKPTPYLGESLYGKVLKTFVNGQLVYDNGKIVKSNCGSLV